MQGSAVPMRQDRRYPFVTPAQSWRIGDLSNPNLKEWARDIMQKDIDEIDGGKMQFSASSSCVPPGVTNFLQGGGPFIFLQTPGKVVIIEEPGPNVRHIYLNVPHSANPKPSWYGESVGRYEGDTLVIDTIGLNGKAHLDNYRTPATDKTHVVERYRLIEDGQKLEAHVTITDPAVLKQPLQVVHRWRKVNQTIVESRCADGEMNNPFEQQRVEPLPTAMQPDF